MDHLSYAGRILCRLVIVAAAWLAACGGDLSPPDVRILVVAPQMDGTPKSDKPELAPAVEWKVVVETEEPILEVKIDDEIAVLDEGFWKAVKLYESGDHVAAIEVVL